jgi:hypothetical protein
MSSSASSSSSSAPAKKGYRFGDLFLNPLANHIAKSSPEDPYHEDPYYFGKLSTTVARKISQKDYYFGKITVDAVKQLCSKPAPLSTNDDVEFDEISEPTYTVVDSLKEPPHTAVDSLKANDSKVDYLLSVFDDESDSDSDSDSDTPNPYSI